MEKTSWPTRKTQPPFHTLATMDPISRADELVQPGLTRSERATRALFGLCNLALTGAAVLSSDPFVLSYIMNDINGYIGCVQRRGYKADAALTQDIVAANKTFRPLENVNVLLAIRLRIVALELGVSRLKQFVSSAKNVLAYSLAHDDADGNQFRQTVFGGQLLDNPRFKDALEEFGVHELGHLTRDHSRKLALMEARLKIGSDLLGASTLNPSWFVAGANIVYFVARPLFVAALKRRYEYEADRMVLVACAHQDNNVFRVKDINQAFIEFEKAGRQARKRQNILVRSYKRLVATHPPTAARIRRLHRQARKLGLQ